MRCAFSWEQTMWERTVVNPGPCLSTSTAMLSMERQWGSTSFWNEFRMTLTNWYYHWWHHFDFCWFGVKTSKYFAMFMLAMGTLMLLVGVFISIVWSINRWSSKVHCTFGFGYVQCWSLLVRTPSVASSYRILRGEWTNCLLNWSLAAIF